MDLYAAWFHTFCLSIDNSINQSAVDLLSTFEFSFSYIICLLTLFTDLLVSFHIDFAMFLFSIKLQ